MGGLIALPFMYIGYVFGSSVSTYLIANSHNSKTSFWETLGFGFVGAGAGISIAFMKKDRIWGPMESSALLGLPILFEILYVNVITPEIYPTPCNTINQNENTNLKDYKDFYNSTKLIKMNLLKISF